MRKFLSLVIIKKAPVSKTPKESEMRKKDLDWIVWISSQGPQEMRQVILRLEREARDFLKTPWYLTPGHFRETFFVRFKKLRGIRLWNAMCKEFPGESSRGESKVNYEALKQEIFSILQDEGSD